MSFNIQNIHHQIWSEPNKPDEIIRCYNQNAVLLNNLKSFRNEDELKLYLEIILKYLNAIYTKERLNETIDIVNHTIKLIDSEIIRLNAINLKDDVYFGILHFKGMASYRVRDYKTAVAIYKLLIDLDSKNDSFKNWLNYSTYGQRLWLVNAINIFCGILILVYFFAKEYIDVFEIRISILAIGFFGLVANWSYEVYIKRSFRRTIKK